MTASQLVPVPANVSLPDLVTALNDRLRRISGLLIPAATPAATGPGRPVPTSATAVVSSGVPAQILYGTHSYRVAAGLPADQSLFVETDRNGLVYQVRGTVWAYLSGTYQRTQAQLAALAATLGTNDTGLLVDVTDFAHVLRWSGSAWAYNDPSDPAGKVQAFLVDPSPATGWHLCDGTANVPYLRTDGTTGTQTVPDLVSATNKAAYMKLGSPAAITVNPAVVPVITGSTGAGTAHSHGVSAVTAIATTTAAVTVVSAAGVNVAAETHTHSLTGSTDTESAHTHPVGTLANSNVGEPQNIVLRPFFRT